MFVRQLREGDEVLLRESVEIDVEGTLRGEEGPEQKPVTYIFDTRGKQWSLHPGDIVKLLHRPYPPGKTECDMLEALDAAIRAYWLGLVKPNEGRQAIARALEAWELGRE